MTAVRRHTDLWPLRSLACLGVLLWSLLVVISIADAAPTDSVNVTSTVGSVLSLSDTCSSDVSITVVLSSFQSGTCTFMYGSTNDATTFLRVSSSAGAFLSGGVFSDHLGGCGSLAGDRVGVKVSDVGPGVTAGLGCTVSAAGTDADFLAVPDTATNACNGTTVGVAENTCTLAIGIRESGGDATAGSYDGTLQLDVIG